jgi:hypothetical protein
MRKFWMAIVIMAMVLGLTGLTGCAKKETKAPVKEEEIGEEGTETETPIEEESEEEAPEPLK